MVSPDSPDDIADGIAGLDRFLNEHWHAGDPYNEKALLKKVRALLGNYLKSREKPEPPEPVGALAPEPGPGPLPPRRAARKASPAG